MFYLTSLAFKVCSISAFYKTAAEQGEFRMKLDILGCH